MNELIEELNALRGKSKPTRFDCTFAITNTGDIVIINHDAPEGLLDDGDSYMEDLLGRVPEKPGAYKGVVEVQTFTCNHPEDPTEWDVNFTLISFEELVFTERSVRKAVIQTVYQAPEFGRNVQLGDSVEVFGDKLLKLQNKIIDSL